jgi:predicted Zn-dependent protease
VSARRGVLAAAVCAALACVTAAPSVPVVPAWHDPAASRFEIGADERELWKRVEELHAELDAEDLFEDAALAAYIDGVLRALLPSALPETAPKPRTFVVRSTDLQAGTSANGAIYLSLGLLAALENEAQLAALLGHELGHFLGRHSLIEQRYERLSKSTVERANLSRAHEHDADRIGLELMRAAGYAPGEAPRLLALMRSEDYSNRTPHPAWESHPYVEARVRRLEQSIRPGDDGKREAERYEAALADSLAEAVQLQLDARMLSRARATLARYQRLRPDSGRGFYLKAELERLAPEGRSAPAVRSAYERAVELAPEDPDALRALGLLCRDLGDAQCAREMLARYLRAAPAADDRKLIERHIEDATAGPEKR